MRDELQNQKMMLVIGKSLLAAGRSDYGSISVPLGASQGVSLTSLEFGRNGKEQICVLAILCYTFVLAER